MATKKSRVAAYLPAEVEESFNQFKLEHRLGDSQALIAILKEYFGVSQSMAHPIAHYATIEQIDELHSKVNRLYAVFEDLKTSVNDDISKVESELESKLNSEPPSATNDIPGQLKLISDSLFQKQEGQTNDNDPQSESLSDTPNVTDLGGIRPLSGHQLSERLGLHKDTVANAKYRHKKNPEKLKDWFCQRDPDGLAWEYNEGEKIYYPVSATPSDQVSPLPEGSERSGEG